MFQVRTFDKAGHQTLAVICQLGTRCNGKSLQYHRQGSPRSFQEDKRCTKRPRHEMQGDASVNLPRQTQRCRSSRLAPMIARWVCCLLSIDTPPQPTAFHRPHWSAALVSPEARIAWARLTRRLGLRLRPRNSPVGSSLSSSRF